MTLVSKRRGKRISPADAMRQDEKRNAAMLRNRFKTPMPSESTDESTIEILISGPLHRFSDWPIPDMPTGPGIYTVWRDAKFLYVGVAGRSIRPTNGPPPAQSLRSRLASHASGRRSGDQFCVYVSDRLVLPALSERLQEIAQGKLSLDTLTGAFVRKHLAFRFAGVADYAAALRLESAIKKSGLKTAGRPFLNPGSTPD
jgi:hypothetical protein